MLQQDLLDVAGPLVMLLEQGFGGLVKAADFAVTQLLSSLAYSVKFFTEMLEGLLSVEGLEFAEIAAVYYLLD